jgi:hypothetical protein
MEVGDFCMSSVDERVVQMKFDSDQFQKGVADTNTSLASLKQSLNLDGAASSLDEITAAGERFSLANMGEAIDMVKDKFNALTIVGITALVNIANQAINTGLSLLNSLTTEPIGAGFEDYNAKLNSIQTIMNATGASIEVVSGYFKELDTYADKTIYNLTDMTSAFAKFTNAGVGMDQSVPAIKGIANMVALAGQDAGAASIAMYNLSQSIANGFLTTTDYKSLNLANVATKEWKDQMIQGALAAGTLEERADGMYHIVGTKAEAVSSAAGLFADNLKEGWASSEVLLAVLGKYGDTTTDIGARAQAAAQDVKSFGMMMETLKAGVGTGWTETFEILVGNLHEAKALFTPLTATISGIFTKMDEARNHLLQGWKDLGGRNDVIETFKSAFNSIVPIVNAVKSAFFEIFPPITAQNLKDITGAVRQFVEGLKPSEETINNIKRVAKGLFAVVDIGRMIFVQIIGVLTNFFGELTSGTGGILAFAAGIGDWLVQVRDAIKNGEQLTGYFGKINEIIDKAAEKFREAGRIVGEFFQNMDKIDTSGATKAIEDAAGALKPLEASADHARTAWDRLKSMVQAMGDFLAPLGERIGRFFGDLGRRIGDSVGSTDWNLVLDGINTGLFAALVLMIRKFFTGGFEDAAEDMSLLDKIKEAFGGITDTLTEMQNSLKAGTLLTIAAAVALLAGAAVALASVDSGKLTQVLGAMAVMMMELVAAMTIMDRMNPLSSIGSMIAMGVGMILMATAIRILVESVEALSKLEWDGLLKGLLGVSVLLAGISVAVRVMAKQSGNMIATGIGLMFLAVAIKILASAVGDFADMDWQKMMQGLIAVGMVLGGLALFTQFSKVNAGAIGQGVGLVLLGAALKILASAVNDFANMDQAKIGQGLGALMSVLSMLAIFSRVINPSGMFSMSVSMVILGAAMKIFASALTDLGSIKHDVLAVGMLAMAGALAVVAATMRVMPKNMLITATALVIVAAALTILADVLVKIGAMSVEAIALSLATLAIALFTIAGAMAAMSGALPGAAALLIVTAALTLFVPVLQQLGAMSLMEVAMGLGVIAATFVILGVAALVLAPVVPILMGLGIAIALLGVGAALAGLGLLAFSAGLTALAAAGAAGTAVLIGIVISLVAMIPEIMRQVGLGLVALAQVIIDYAPKFGEAMIAVMTTILNVIDTMAPRINQTLWGLIMLLVESLITSIPYFVDAGYRLLIGILDGIANNIGQVVDSSTNIIVNFLDGLARNMPRIVESGTNLVIKFIEGIGNSISRITEAGADVVIDTVNAIANTIETRSGELRDAGGRLATAIVDGMTGGLWTKAKDVAQAAWDLGAKAIAGIKNALDSNSPSKETYKLGTYGLGSG